MDADRHGDAIWRRGVKSGAIAASILLIATIAAYAGDPAKPAPTSTEASTTPWLLGDWGGERTKLQKQGVDIQFGYVSEVALNALGAPRPRSQTPTSGLVV